MSDLTAGVGGVTPDGLNLQTYINGEKKTF